MLRLSGFVLMIGLVAGGCKVTTSSHLATDKSPVVEPERGVSEHFQRFEKVLMPQGRSPETRAAKTIGTGCALETWLYDQAGKPLGLDLMINGEKVMPVVLHPKGEITFRSLRSSIEGIVNRYTYTIKNPIEALPGYYRIDLDYDFTGELPLRVKFTHDGGFWHWEQSHTCEFR